MRRPFVVHPFLLAVHPIFFLCSYNVSRIGFGQTLLPSTISLGATFLLLLLFKLILKDRQKAGIVVSILVTLFFIYGHVYNLLEYPQIGTFLIGLHVYMLLNWLILAACSIHFVRKTRRDLSHITRIVNVAAFVLVAIPLVGIGIHEFKTVPWDSVQNPPYAVINTTDLKKAERPPDIYYIILDRYASSDILKEFYDFDNIGFVNYLEGKGFYVAHDSTSNYLTTAHSLASSLNMTYLDHLQDQIGEESGDWGPLTKMIKEYEVGRLLKSIGYKYIHFGSWWQDTRINRYADVNVNLFSRPEFFLSVYRTTALYPVGRALGLLRLPLLQSMGDERMLQWRRVQHKFEELAEIPSMKGPKFVFVHMLVPHKPFVFNQDGTFVPEEEERERSKKVNYVNQLVFVNNRVQILIDRLLSSSEIPPVIVLQADEGPYPPSRSTDWNQASKSELRQKMGILNAYYLPDVNKDELYSSVTPVNTFRLIFNLYFDTELPLLPDENYVHTDNHHPYRLIQVTSKLGRSGDAT